LFWYNRGSRLLPTSAAERELWTIWIGYFTTYFFIIIVLRLLAYLGVLQTNPQWPAHAYFLELLPYPFIALVSGLAFFIMGANYWGRCYAIGGAFFLMAPVMALDLTLGPLLFGIAWTITLVMFGRHLGSQGRPVPKPAAAPSTQMPTVQYKEP
jgi:eukaryotic-like serine/threonine-protein kinase